MIVRRSVVKLKLTFGEERTEELAPAELESALAREMLLDRVVHPLDDQLLEARLLHEIRVRRPVAERVARPAALQQRAAHRTLCAQQCIAHQSASLNNTTLYI